MNNFFMDYFLLFTAGLLSSMHCVGMCGCFVTSYSIKLRGSNLQRAISHLGYSFGRITTYTFIGAIMGLIGSNLYFLGKMAGIQNYLIIAMSIIMIYFGLSLANFVPKIQWLDKSGELFLKYSQKPFAKIMKNKSILSTYPLGLVLGFLPCCLLYTIEIQAMNTGSPIKGALSMFFFGLGTIPALFTFGMSVNFIDNRIKNKLINFASYILIFMGCLSIYRVFN